MVVLVLAMLMWALCSSGQPTAAFPAVADTTTRRFWAAADADVAWLAALQEPAVLAELQALADHDLGNNSTTTNTTNHHTAPPQFVANFGPNGDLAGQAGGWTALPLLNKGALSLEGCLAAPRTCATLGRLATQLAPTPSAPEVGARVLKLDAGATIRPHVGPGGRLVAHLGLRVPPTGAALTVAGERRAWRE
jgi:hypothetical protein